MEINPIEENEEVENFPNICQTCGAIFWDGLYKNHLPAHPYMPAVLICSGPVTYVVTENVLRELAGENKMEEFEAKAKASFKPIRQLLAEWLVAKESRLIAFLDAVGPRSVYYDADYDTLQLNFSDKIEVIEI